MAALAGSVPNAVLDVRSQLKALVYRGFVTATGWWRLPDLAAETARVTALGATRVTADPIEEDGWIWHVLADPDGNEFCVLQPPSRNGHAG